MADVINIDELKKQKNREQKNKIVNALVSLAAQVKAGEVVGRS